MRKLPSVTKHKPEINSRAADEIALAGGGVKEPVGFQNEMHLPVRAYSTPMNGAMAMNVYFL